jgi:8-oxo-dGTP diphosphatase
MIPNKFNIRAYGVIIKDEKVLLVKEKLRNFSFVKFPGGGVEKGEGPLDALKREMMEELQTTISSYRHFYTTEFFQVSAFNPEEQIISIYYSLDLDRYPDHGSIHLEPEHQMEFCWMSLETLIEEDVTFPIDKHVVRLILGRKNL